MAEVELRLTEMKEATERFRRSGIGIDLSIDQIRTLITPMLPFIDAGLVSQYRAEIALMEELSLLLREFADKLGQATHDVQWASINLDELLALRAARMASPASGNASIIYSGYNEARPMPDINDVPDTPALEEVEPQVDIYAFVSDNNQPLYHHLLDNQATLSAQEQRLDQLIANRETLVEDLDALRNRMSSYNDLTGRSMVSLDSVPRVEALHDQINLIDHQIVEVRSNIEQLQTNIAEAMHRLENVAPGPHADLAIVAYMQQAQTDEIVLNNTFGCVNHVVNRVPIPLELARDAHLWDDMALQHPEYGIRIGETPLVGAVIVMETDHRYADDVNGHLMYIERIDEDGGVWITDNFHPDTPVLLSDLTDEVTGSNIHYLYLPWHTKA